MNKFRVFIKEYFNFSKRERNGILVLIIILILLISARFVVNNIHKNKRVDFTEFEAEIDEFIAYQTPDLSKERFLFDPNTASSEELLSLGLSPKSVNGILEYREKDWKFYKPEDLMRVRDITEEEYEYLKDYINIPKKTYSSDYKYQYPENSSNEDNHELFYFDPNTATKDELEKLGFLSWQADNIIKYRDKGGYFSRSDDIEKIYGLDDDFIAEIKPWIQIENQENPKEINESSNSDFNIDLNSASAEDLQKLNGIGPSYSKRIVDYRTKLGGYININQLMEVYGMTDELFNSIKDSFIIDKTNIKKIDINKAEYKEIISHPYIDKETTIGIVNYREFKGTIGSVDELKSQKVISEDTFNKILPYIKTE